MRTEKEDDQRERVMDEHEAAKGGKQGEEATGEDGLGSKTGALGGHDDPGSQESGTSPGGSADDGPVKGEHEEAGGGDATGPTPSGVPQEGEVDPDASTATGST